ncbi:MAG: M23 family metallopeptidase [Eubacteriales bacterium]|nr:M23 family metallopeptidase [Eubacteriales bacterium]
MRKHALGGRQQTLRHIPYQQIWLATHRSVVIPTVISVLLIFAILMGYIIGHTDPRRAYTLSEAAGLAQMEIDRASEQDRILTVEQINLKQQLNQEKYRNDALANEMGAVQEEMDNIEATILNALMSNLTDKMVSRSGASVSSYTTEAKNLISLNQKLLDFKKTDLAERVDISEYEELLTSRLDHLPTLKPVPGALSGYGYRRHPVYGYYHFHPAVDMSNPKGTPIKAAGAGKVIGAEYHSGAGNQVVINHGNGFTTTYMHCSKFYVKVGDYVEKGDKIAAVGNTGTSTGSHLHFEIRLYGSPVNPKSIVLES